MGDAHYLKFRIPEDVATQIASPGGDPPDKLHVTLAFLGRSWDIGAATQEKVVSILRRASDTWVAPLVTVDFLGYFPRRDTSQGVWWRAVSGTMLRTLREHLVRDLNSWGIRQDMTFADWQPHVTIRRGKAMTFEELDTLRVVRNVRLTDLAYKAGDEEYVFPMRPSRDSW